MKPGQTLVVLMIFMTMAITVTSMAVVLIINNTQAASRIEQGLIAYNIAESGMENALMRLLRNPSYTGETLTINSGTATITVTGSDPMTVLSIGRWNNFTRRIQATASYVDGIMSVSSWGEVY
jgi:hypothetical protein